MLWLVLVVGLLQSCLSHVDQKGELTIAGVTTAWKEVDEQTNEKCGTLLPSTEDLVRIHRFYGQDYGSRCNHVSKVTNIPVCVHSIHHTDGTGRLTEDQMQFQIQQLNVAFSAQSCCNLSLDWCEEDMCSQETGIHFVFQRNCSSQIANNDCT